MSQDEIELSHEDEILLLQIGTIAAQVRLNEIKNGKVPEKFKLANEAVSNLLIKKPITLSQFNGLADTVGGFYCAMDSLVENHGGDPKSLNDAEELMKLVERIRVQIKRIELVRGAKL